MKYLIILFWFASCSTKYKIDYNKIINLEQQGFDSVDLKEYNFKNTATCAQLFIDKFELTDDEIIMIGFWKNAAWLLKPYNHKTDKIGIYSFLPNRKFIKSTYIDDTSVKILYGNWRVVDKKLHVSQLSQCIYKYGKIIDYKSLTETKYENIFSLVNYEKYPINTTTFIGESNPKYRRFHDFVNYGSDIYSPLSKSGFTLFNPIDSEDYILKVLNLDHFYFY